MAGFKRNFSRRSGFNQEANTPYQNSHRGGHVDYHRGRSYARGAYEETYDPQEWAPHNGGMPEHGNQRGSFGRNGMFSARGGNRSRNRGNSLDGRNQQRKPETYGHSSDSGSTHMNPSESQVQTTQRKDGAAVVLPRGQTVKSSDTNIFGDDSPFWDADYEPQHDIPVVAIKPPSTHLSLRMEMVEERISSCLTRMGLGRSNGIIITANPPTEPTCMVPTPHLSLTRSLLRRTATMVDLEGEINLGTEHVTLVAFQPVLKEAEVADNGTAAHPTFTLAEEFIKHPRKNWWNDKDPGLRAETFYCEKLLIWARALLVSETDKNTLARAGVVPGILGSLYEARPNWSLIQAFLTFWNSSGHTLITSQGEMGFPLLALQDAMGIPISGRVYDEYVPDSCFQDAVAGELFSAYTTICFEKLESDNGGDGRVTLFEWTNHFLHDSIQIENCPHITLPQNFYADIEDPLLQSLNFRMDDGKSKALPPAIHFSNQVMRFNSNYSKMHLRAAFIAAWLCSYCVPVSMGAYIRPEVFMAAATIAKGVRRAIGVASMAYFYESVDSIQEAT